MDKDEKIELLKHILTDEALDNIGRMESDKLKDFNECISIFLSTNDRINEEGALKTLQLMLKGVQ
ncbi:hypothetical protein V7114_18285 [Neobacillus niacini]|uniref:hypothetical protein n=1 Tax=Neobacillus niacini TaxID=86668 RepID=UPI002FFE1A8F